MECLKNSLQILCIYAELLNSAVLLFIFYFLVLLVYPVAVSDRYHFLTATSQPAGLGAAPRFPLARRRVPPVYLCIV